MTARTAGRPRHLMQVVYSLSHGGSEHLAYNLALRLDPVRVRSSICALTHGGPMAEALGAGGVPFHIVGCGPGRQWRVILRLYRLFRDHHVDIVQTHHLKQLLYSAIGARLAGAALVHVEHEFFSLRSPRMRRYLRIAAPLCHRIVVVGDEVKAFLADQVGLPRSKITVIHNGVDVERYAPRPRVGRAGLGLPPQGRLIGHVARLEPEKDQQGLLTAFRLVAEAHSDVRLVIVGEGSQRTELERTARALGVEERVHFLGVRADISELLPHVELFVLPSLNEGLPLAVLEAMACGRPVLATAVGEIPRVVRDGLTGVTVPPGDATALVRAINLLLDNPDRAATMGAVGRRLIAEQFNLNGMVARYQTLYEALPAGNGERPMVPGGSSVHPASP